LVKPFIFFWLSLYFSIKLFFPWLNLPLGKTFTFGQSIFVSWQNFYLFLAKLLLLGKPLSIPTKPLPFDKTSTFIG
jgi:hypothetical protein